MGSKTSWDSIRHQWLWAGYMTVANQPLLSSELNLSQISRRKKGKTGLTWDIVGSMHSLFCFLLPNPIVNYSEKTSNPSWVTVRRLSGVADGISSPKQSFLLNQPAVLIVHFQCTQLAWHPGQTCDN